MDSSNIVFLSSVWLITRIQESFLYLYSRNPKEKRSIQDLNFDFFDRWVLTFVRVCFYLRVVFGYVRMICFILDRVSVNWKSHIGELKSFVVSFWHRDRCKWDLNTLTLLGGRRHHSIFPFIFLNPESRSVRIQYSVGEMSHSHLLYIVRALKWVWDVIVSRGFGGHLSTVISELSLRLERNNRHVTVTPVVPIIYKRRTGPLSSSWGCDSPQLPSTHPLNLSKVDRHYSTVMGRWRFHHSPLGSILYCKFILGFIILCF